MTTGIQFGQGADVITLHNATSSIAIPAASGIGADVSRWASLGRIGPMGVDIEIGASALTTLTGPVSLYGEKADGTVENVGDLNGGADIVIPNGVIMMSFEATVGPYTRLAIGPKTVAASPLVPSGGASVTVTATPILQATT